MELEKKRMRPIKRTFKGPYIQHHSVSMPILPRTSKGRNANTPAPTIDPNDPKTKCERTFITFENDINDTAFQKFFKTKSSKQNPPSYICPITK